MAGTSIYGLVDPRSGLIRYVGKTVQTLELRMRGHRYDSLNRAGNHKDHWIAKLYREGTPPLMILIEADSCWERECFWIAHYRAAGIDLLNRTEGGEGVKGPMSPEQRAKHSAAMKGRKRTPEHQAKLNAVRTGQKRSAESCERMRVAHLGQRPANLDQLIALAKARAKPGYTPRIRGGPSKFSDETRKRQSEAQKRRLERERAARRTDEII